MVGPDEKLRRRDGFKLTDNRYTRREVLSEIHYCVLCHERDKDTCSKGIRDKEGKVTTNPLGIPLAGCPLDEKISEMHTVRKRGDAIGALAIVDHRQPDVPGHRPSHLQRLHEGLHLPEAGAGQHPADRNRRADRRAQHAVGRRDLRAADALEPAQHPAARTRSNTTARTCWSSASGPAGYTLSHYLLNEGFGVVAIDGLKIEPLPEDITGTAERGAAADPRLERDLSPARRAHARRLRRRVRVRHHRALGQELPDADPPDAGAPRQAEDLRRRALRRRAADRRSVGGRASITSRSPPAPAGRRSSTSRTT